MVIETRLTYRPAEAAQALGVSRQTIDRLIEQGALKSFTVGGSGAVGSRTRLIRAEELDRYIREREQA